MEKEKKFIITESQVDSILDYLKRRFYGSVRKILKNLPLLDKSEGGNSDVSTKTTNATETKTKKAE